MIRLLFCEICFVWFLQSCPGGHYCEWTTQMCWKACGYSLFPEIFCCPPKLTRRVLISYCCADNTSLLNRFFNTSVLLSPTASVGDTKFGVASSFPNNDFFAILRQSLFGRPQYLAAVEKTITTTEALWALIRLSSLTRMCRQLLFYCREPHFLSGSVPSTSYVLGGSAIPALSILQLAISGKPVA